MEFTARQIAAELNGTVEGNPDVIISNLSKIEEGIPGTMSFLANRAYTSYIYTSKSSIVVVNRDFIPIQPISATLIRVDDAYSSFAHLLELFNPNKCRETGISPLSFISKTARVGDNAYICEFVFIGKNVVVGNNVNLYPHVYVGDNTQIGDDSTLLSGVKLYPDTIIGRKCTIHSGVVIGSDGFGFAPQTETEYKKLIQVGNVIIEDNVEIGANTTIDRATLGSTRISKGVKLDNLIQLGHNVEIGENTVIAAQTGIAGSTKIGKNCLIGGQVGIVGHLVIGDNVKIGAQSGIEHDIKDGDIYLGTPALEIKKTRRLYVHWRNFDEIVRKISRIERLLLKK
jgi:UDP-3-O-[3-hydroxymyristoyl] glucosamine N-acyltransferase